MLHFILTQKRQGELRMQMVIGVGHHLHMPFLRAKNYLCQMEEILICIHFDDHESDEEEDTPEGPIQGGSSAGANRIYESMPIPIYFRATHCTLWLR